MYFFLFVDPGGVVSDEEGGSIMLPLSYSSVPEPTQKNDNNPTPAASGNASPSAEMPPASATSDVVEVTPAWESAVDMETPIPPVSPTSSSRYHSPTSTPSTSVNGDESNNDSLPDLEDPKEHCTIPSVDDIEIGPFNEAAVVLFTLFPQDRPLCKNGVYGVRLAKWGPFVTSGTTVNYSQLQWGPWVMGGSVLETYERDNRFLTFHSDVTVDEAYYAQIAIGMPEDFIDGFPAPSGSVISNVVFLGTQGTLCVSVMDYINISVH